MGVSGLAAEKHLGNKPDEAATRLVKWILRCTKVHTFVSALFESVQALVDTARAFFAVKVFGNYRHYNQNKTLDNPNPRLIINWQKVRSGQNWCSLLDHIQRWHVIRLGLVNPTSGVRRQRP